MSDNSQHNVELARIITNSKCWNETAEANNIFQKCLAKWPKDKKAKYLMTSGGFLSADLSNDYSGSNSWRSQYEDFDIFRNCAEAKLKEFLSNDIKQNLANRASYLIIGVDVFGVAGRNKNRRLLSELIAFINLSEDAQIHWTGKSYPTTEQARNLYQVPDLKTHLKVVDGELVALLGCHDLQIFNPRGAPNENGKGGAKGERAERRTAYRDEIINSLPQVILHMPHYTTKVASWRAPIKELGRIYRDKGKQLKVFASSGNYFAEESSKSGNKSGKKCSGSTANSKSKSQPMKDMHECEFEMHNYKYIYHDTICDVLKNTFETMEGAKKIEKIDFLYFHRCNHVATYISG